MDANVVHAMKVSIGECGCSFQTRRSFESVLIAQCANRVGPTQNGTKVTVCAAITSEIGIVIYIVKSDGLTNELLANSLEEVRKDVIAEYGSNLESYIHTWFLTVCQVLLILTQTCVMTRYHGRTFLWEHTFLFVLEKQLEKSVV